MKKILVLTDFSDAARHAAEYAVMMAAELQADVILLHIYQLPLLYPEENCSMGQDDLQRITVKELNLLADDLSGYCDKKVAISTEIRTGTFFVELMYACAYVQPYLVVMGSYGNTASRFMLWGSHTAYSMKHLPYPLLAVPPSATYKPIRKTCFVFNGKEMAFTIPADVILAICKDLKSELFIVTTTDKILHKDDALRESGILAKSLFALHPTVHMVDHYHRDTNILTFCEQFNIDLLIAVPKTYSLLDTFYQNNIRQFISHSNIPVLALH